MLQYHGLVFGSQRSVAAHGHIQHPVNLKIGQAFQRRHQFLHLGFPKVFLILVDFNVPINQFLYFFVTWEGYVKIRSVFVEFLGQMDIG